MIKSILDPIDRLEVPSLEAIDFQFNSRFPGQLKAIIDRVFVFAGKHDAEYGVPDERKAHFDKHTRMVKFMETKIFPEMEKLIRVNTGLKNVKMTTILPSNSSNAMGAFMYADTKNKKFTEMLAQATSFPSDKLASRGLNEELEKLFMMSDGLDKKSGRLTKMAGLIPFIFNLPVGFFVNHELYPYADKFELTSNEIVAVCLHEIGHSMTFVEYMGSIQYTGSFGNVSSNDIASDMQKYPEKTQANIKKLIAKIKKSPEYKKSAVLKKIAGATEIIIEDDDLFRTLANSENYESSFKVMFLITLIKILMYAHFELFSKFFLGASLVFKNIFEKVDESPGRKTSREYVIRERNDSLYERLADEYVSRYQMSQYLNTALIKITELSLKLNTSGILVPFYSKSARQSIILKVFLGMVSTGPMSAVLLGSRLLTGGVPYEQFNLRLKRNIQNMKVAFKTETLPKEIRDELLSQLHDAEADYKKFNSSLSQRFQNVAEFIINFPFKVGMSPLLLLTSINKSRYRGLFEDIDSLLGDESFVYAAKIQKIFED